MKLEIPEKIKTIFNNLDEKNRYYVFCGILLFIYIAIENLFLIIIQFLR